MGNFGRSLGIPSPLKPTALIGTEAAQGVQFGTLSSCSRHVTPRNRLPRSPKLPALWPDRVAEIVEDDVALEAEVEAPSTAESHRCTAAAKVWD